MNKNRIQFPITCNLDINNILALRDFNIIHDLIKKRNIIQQNLQLIFDYFLCKIICVRQWVYKRYLVHFVKTFFAILC